MKNLICKSLLVLILLCLMVWIGPASARSQITTGVTFKTAFPFTIGNTKLPAGSYTIRPMEDGSDIMEISSADGKTSALFETMTSDLPKTPSKGEVVFKKYDDNYVLSEIYEQGSKSGAMVIKSHAERQHAKKSGAPTKESVGTTKTT